MFLFLFYISCALCLSTFFYVCFPCWSPPLPSTLPGPQSVSHHRRCRSMSVCVPPSSFSFSHVSSSPAVHPKQPTTPPDLSSSSLFTAASLCAPLISERDTFAGRLSKALETVLPLQSASSLPGARQRRASLPALFATPVGSKDIMPTGHSGGENERGREREKKMMDIGHI